MADNVNVTEGSGKVIAADDISSVFYQRVKLSLGADGTAVDAVAGSGVNGTGVQRVTIATDDVIVASLATKLDTIHTDLGTTPSFNAGVNGAAVQRITVATDDALTVAAQAIQATGKTCTTTFTRPNDTTTYGANEGMSDATSGATTFTLTGAARASGGTGIITDIMVISNNDPSLLLQGELWIFDSAPSAAAQDNATWVMADADAVLLVAVIPFAMVTTIAGSGSNSYAHLTGLGYGYTCIGSANLRYHVKVKNAYVPAAQEQITVRVKCQYTS